MSFDLNTGSLLKSVSSNWRGECAVFIAGMSSMGLEVTAGRILAPTYGSSTYTWGAILGVFMIALSTGYWLGGKRAKHASRNLLTTILVSTAVAIAFTAALDEIIIELSLLLPLPSIYAPILPILLLFGPAAFFLGLISPFTAELAEQQSTGEASGRVYTVGTIGSIFGAFVTTYSLIPNLSIFYVEIIFVSVLIVVAILISVPPSLSQISRIATAIVLVVGLVGFAPVTATSGGGDVVYETQTPYQQMRIVDDNGIRTLYLNNHPQSAMYIDGRSGYVFEYARFAHLAYLYRQPESINRVLVIGGGGFTIPKQFTEQYNVTVDVVEIDPEVVGAAKKYFNASESEDVNIYVTDGRQFLRQTNRTYDLIILDAYQKNHIPFHLTTVQFMELVYKHLDSQGVLVENVISSATGPRSRFYRSQYKTIQRVFPSVDAFPVKEKPRSIQNVMIIATKGEDLSESELHQRAARREIGVNLSTEVSHYLGPRTIQTKELPVLRDGKAPVNRLTKPLLGRRFVIQRTNTTQNNSKQDNAAT